MTSYNWPQIRSVGFKKIRFANYCFSNEFYSALGRLLEDNNALGELAVVNCGMTPAKLAKFGPRLLSCKELRIIDFSRNRLGHGCGGIVSQLLGGEMQGLQGANHEPGLGRWEAKELRDGAGARVSEAGLDEINLDSNGITDEPIVEICQKLKMGSRLRSLNLRMNKIGKAGVNELISTLSENESLLSLDIR